MGLVSPQDVQTLVSTGVFELSIDALARDILVKPYNARREDLLSGIK